MTHLVHYHVILECGHRTGMDTANLEHVAMDEAAKQGLLSEAGDWSIGLPCNPCGGIERGSTSVVEIGPATDPCPCKAA